MNRRLSLFILALILGIALKVAVQEGEQTSVQAISNVTIQTPLPPGFLIVNELESARIQVRGKISDMSGLSPLAIRIVADVAVTEPTTLEVPLGPKDVQIPGEFEVLSVEPAVLFLEIDRELTKTLPIQITVVGEPAAGAQAGGVEVRPASVAVIGPEQLLLNLTELSANVSVERRAISFEERVSLSLPPSVRLANPTPIVAFVPMIEPVLSIDGAGGDRGGTGTGGTGSGSGTGSATGGTVGR